MAVEIRTLAIEPIRNTYGHTARRFGDKPATRYQEASFDIEAKINFHYKPLWDPQRTLNDNARTNIKMVDWYSVTDPRQYYYGSYVANRAKMQEVAESNFSFCDKNNVVENLNENLKNDLLRLLVPFRHMELAANMNNSKIAGDAVAATVAQMHIFTAMDRLGMGQYLSRIALMIDGATGQGLDKSKDYWMNDPLLQPLRKLAEDTLVIDDWFELSFVQNLLIDGFMYPFVYEVYDKIIQKDGGVCLSMLTEFMRDWHKETQRWVNAMCKTVYAENDENKILMESWTKLWIPVIKNTFLNLANEIGCVESLNEIESDLNCRLAKFGLIVSGESK
ncbi:aromatic/alkene monooxygenase hydroxylase subunit beta [Zhongshania sp. BJYM1]|uniref:aromatic/alkene monooxygenase hydroxylase subunit beta n=1 Tax=Zhongshania aquatica TaxID=2965069 RepID=UPI0022B5902C|nr:aromatic/alkene monooxygenase hydroxylase subunit beta [Marortus sp. BJYM1]